MMMVVMGAQMAVMTAVAVVAVMTRSAGERGGAGEQQDGDGS